MDGSGEHVKWSKPVQEDKDHVFSHIWKINTYIIIYTYINVSVCIYAEHISKSGTVRGD
jgi:hypothetical protein